MSTPFSLVKQLACLIYGFLLIPVLANEPGNAALRFLEKVRAGEVNLDPGGDTALQDNTADAKRDLIRKGLVRLEGDLKGGSLEIAEVKEDDDFAAVMVKRGGGFDSSRLQMFPVALVRQGADWIAAPVLASFENAVAGYTVAVGKRLVDLEGWMLRERVLGLEKLISESAERTRAEIRGSMVGEVLEGDDLGKITDHFLEACESGNQAAVLGFLGGLGDPFPDDWAMRMKASRAVLGAEPYRSEVWRLLVSPDVVRVRVHQEGTNKSGLVSVACLDPARAEQAGTLGKIELIHFEFTRGSSGLWRLDLPAALLLDDAGVLNADDDLDVALLDSFSLMLREMEPIVAADTARDAQVAVIEGLAQGGLRKLLRRVDFGGRPKDARIAASAAAEAWWSMNKPGAIHVPVELGFKEEGILAAAVYQWFSPKASDSFEMRTLYFKKTAAGWVWAPGVVSDKEREAQKNLSIWIKTNEPEWRISWRETLLKPSLKIDAIDFAKLATDAEVKNLIDSWLLALNERDIGAALAMTTWFGGKGDIPMKALRNLSYDLADAPDSEAALEGIYRSESWVAAAVTGKSAKLLRRSFLPILMTNKGARVIPGIDLVAGEDRTRRFLNEASFGRLKVVAGEEKMEELKALFGKFEKKAKTN